MKILITLICNLYKKEKNKLNLDLKNYDQDFIDNVINYQMTLSQSVSNSWIDYKDQKSGNPLESM
jgi:hypothetical protein